MIDSIACDLVALEVAEALSALETTDVRGISVASSPDFDAYAEGRISADQIRCVLCGLSPCSCPPFGSPEYFDLINRRHGKRC